MRRDKNKAPQTKTPRTIRQILLDAETQRKKTVTAIIQGKVAATAYGEPQPAVMEEDEFVEALQSLANVADEDITEATGMDYLQVGDLVELRYVYIIFFFALSQALTILLAVWRDYRSSVFSFKHLLQRMVNSYFLVKLAKSRLGQPVACRLSYQILCPSHQSSYFGSLYGKFLMKR